VAAQDHSGDEQPSRAGYIGAIVVSALGHAALIVVVFFIAPAYLRATPSEVPSYTVKIVDNIPAGDLGTHLPRINRSSERRRQPAPPKPVESSVKTTPPKIDLAPDSDPNALALNTRTGPTPTITPTPEPTIVPTPEPSQSIKPTPKPKKHATPRPTPQPAKRNPSKPESTVARAKPMATPNVAARLAALKRKNFEEHVKAVAKKAAEEKKLAAAEAASDDDDDSSDNSDDTAGGGPVAAKVATNGSGMGIGTGTGSAGILQDPEFILYYKTVQDQIKKAWSFTGGSNDLTATVDFAIRPDGTLAGLKVGHSSNDTGFDDSVVRAIRFAAPFPAPPEKFRDQFSSGIEAVFQLGELKS
jgi:TonB family protein